MKHCVMFVSKNSCGQQASFMVTSAILEDYPSCRVHLPFAVDMAIGDAPHKDHYWDSVTVQRIQRSKKDESH